MEELASRTAVFALGILVMVFPVCASTESNPDAYKVYFLDSFPVNNPTAADRDWFPCVGSIYMAVVGPRLPARQGVIKTTWISPSGKVLHKFNYHKQTQTPQGTAHWFGIRLHRAAGQSILSWANQSVGMEKFIGTWTVKLSIKDRRAGRFTFEAIC